MEQQNKNIPPEEQPLMAQPPVTEEIPPVLEEPVLMDEPMLLDEPLPQEEPAGPMPELDLEPEFQETPPEEAPSQVIIWTEEDLMGKVTKVSEPKPIPVKAHAVAHTEPPVETTTEWDAPEQEEDPFFTQPEPVQTPEPEAPAHYRLPRKGRPKRKKGYGLFGLPHLAASLVWLAIIVSIGTSLGRMLWVCAADVLAFGRESKIVSVTITSKDTIEDIAEKLYDAELIRYPQVFKLYAKLAVDEGDILPGTFELDTIYDYHALVVQMGPRSSTRNVIEDVLIPEGLNCRQIFELLEQKNICTVAELEEYAASGEFDDYWFLEGVERGDKYCLEGFLFPDTYDFYVNSTPREALGKMLLGFQARVDQEETTTALAALNERLSGMMRAKGCSEEHIAGHQLSLRDLLIVASLIEEETASSKESPRIASVIFNRLTEDQLYERYLNIDAAIIYATGDAANIDTSIDHPYNTYKYAGLTPGPISNPGLDSIQAALHFEDTQFYYYVLNPETDMHQFSKTLEEHNEWVEKFRGMGQ